MTCQMFSHVPPKLISVLEFTILYFIATFGLINTFYLAVSIWFDVTFDFTLKLTVKLPNQQTGSL